MKNCIERNTKIQTHRWHTLFAAFCLLYSLISNPVVAQEIKVGIIGLDTSHAIAFTKLMNDPKAKAPLDRCRVVCAYPPGSPDIESSVSRVPKYTKEIEQLGVEIVDSIDKLIERVDAVMLESNDGRPHFEQVLPVLRANKPVFVDKPIAGSLVDTIAIFEAAKKFGTPVFSSSSLRFTKNALLARNEELVGNVVGCDVFSPCSLEKTHPDLYWYGIHGVEQLFTVMGTGCQSVTRISTKGTDVAVGVWEGGRIGSFRGLRDGKRGYGGTVFGKNGQASTGGYEGYQGLVIEIAKFFESKEPPVNSEETIEIYAFMSAADESKKTGAPVNVGKLIEAARAKAMQRIESIK